MRTSILNNRDAVIDATLKANSMRETLELLGLRPAGGNYKALRAACAKFNISVPRSDPTRQTSAARETNRISDEDLFVENSTYMNRYRMKQRMFRMGIPNECKECGQGPEWNGLPLVLTLDHINGVANDNRLENLRILCPNCHSQTDTFCGKSIRKAEPPLTTL